MKTYTKENPGNLLDLIKYLSDKTGISTQYKKTFKSYKEAGFRSNIIYILNGEQLPQLSKIQRKGNVEMITDQLTKTFNLPINTKFDEIYTMIYRDIEDFGIIINKTGKYKDDEGNGWYCMKQLFEIDGKYFIQ